MVKRMKGKMRSALSGRVINGSDVILASEAEEYLKQMGYVVRKPYDNPLDALDEFMLITINHLGGKKNEQEIKN